MPMNKDKYARMLDELAAEYPALKDQAAELQDAMGAELGGEEEDFMMEEDSEELPPLPKKKFPPMDEEEEDEEDPLF